MRRLVQTVGSALPWLIPGIFGAAWYLAIGGGHTIPPTNVWWMLQGDWFCYLFSSLFYRNSPWAIPFGQIPELLYPFGSSAALTDALPLVNTVGKLFSPLLPEEFQLYGLWMLSGFVIMAILGSRFVARVSDDRVLQVLGGVLLGASPILCSRYGHPPFSALWAVFGLIGLALAPRPSSPWADQRLAWFFLFFCCATHPYLAVMALAMAYAVALRAVLSRELAGARNALLALATPAVVALVTFWLFGYLSSFGKVQGEAEGFGQFSADLSTLFNPGPWSRLFGPIQTGPRQYEGYAYLGLGGVVMAVSGLAWLFGRSKRRALWPLVPLLIFALALAFYALSNVVTFRGQVVWNLVPTYAHLGSLPQIFRSSGRFVWPLHGVLVLSGLAAAAHLSLRSRALGRALLGVAVVAQLADLNIATSTLGNPHPPFVPLQSEAWKHVGADYRHIAVIPIQISWFSPFDQNWIAKLSWEAYRQKMTINSGYVGRPPVGLTWDQHLTREELDPQTVYVVYFREYVNDFVAAGWSCGPAEGVLVCVDPTRATPFRAAIEAALQRREPYALPSMR